MGAFGRANVYKENTPEIKKTYFKNKLKGYLDDMINSNYLKPIAHFQHLENINELIHYSKMYGEVLRNDTFNFGVTQKLLNLYLKYHWCLGLIPAPPHFPVDSIIQKKLGLKVVPWTKFEDDTEYLRIISHSETLLEKYDCSNIAELELKLFSRNI
ncbi:hypothetical protein A9Q93_12950 [Nonlabens dokdonensis]|uniref:Uncharacterized protein n=2 Tax=Nonlabens dokdonensis TaxID=328515 RepID=A0A1Z8AJE7_9FLAO|nr:hypothetical protein A9Q93_12950 [Nonlabens dokdonensis]